MPRTTRNPLLLALVVSVAHVCTARELIVYSRIPGRAPSDHYRCRISFEGDVETSEAFVLQTKAPVSNRVNGYFQNTRNWTASFINVEFSGAPLVVEISRVTGEPITKAKVRPEGANQSVVVRDGKVFLTIREPMHISVDVDGQMEDRYTGMGYDGPPVHSMLVFANPVIHDRPVLGEPGVLAAKPGAMPPKDGSWKTLCFMPGVHDVGLAFPIGSRQSVYIPGDAVVHGTFRVVEDGGKARNARLFGYGVISGERIAYIGRMGMSKEERAKGRPLDGAAADSRFEGVTFIDPSYHTVHIWGAIAEAPNTFANLKILGWRANGDGINAFAFSTIKNCFVRTSDDSFYLGRNVHISDTVIWNDSNGASIRLCGAPNQGGERSSFTNINVIYHRARWHYWSGGRVISFRGAGPGATIRNVLVDNVVVEDPRPAFPPFYFTMEQEAPVETRQVMENIVIQNVVQHHPGVTAGLDENRGRPRNTMLGLNEDNTFSNITFRNCRYRGKVIRSFSDGDFKTNEFVHDIRFGD